MVDADSTRRALARAFEMSPLGRLGPACVVLRYRGGAARHRAPTQPARWSRWI
jgi:hypothetical protein